MENKLFIISGNSGAGKSSVMNSSCLKDNKIVTSTTRPKRDGEVEGEDYYFLSEEEFEHLVSSDKIIAVTKYAGNYYGIHEDELFSRLEEGDAYVILDYHGALDMMYQWDEKCYIFIYSDFHGVIMRLKDRGDSKADIKKRLSNIEEELEYRHGYDYIIKNIQGRKEYTVDIINSIIKSESNYF